MADDGKLDKLKEQYIDEIIGIVPLSQAVFIVLMSLVSDRILSGKSTDVLSAIAALGLKSSLGPDDGRFWQVSLLAILISFVLALLNIFFMRWSLSYSLRRANLRPVLNAWQLAAASRISTLTEEQKAAVHTSFKNEIEARLKKYKSKRISTELIFSIASLVFYATIFLLCIFHKNNEVSQWSARETLFIFSSGILAIVLHASSVRYAISKILPLKVYIGVITGELLFFEEITA